MRKLKNSDVLLIDWTDNQRVVCSQSLLALRTLRQHGLPDDALR